MKQLNRKTWVIIAAVAGFIVLVAAVLALLYVNVWAQPGKQDFSDASVRAKKISDQGASKSLGEFITKVNEQSRAGVTQPKLAESAAEQKKKIDGLLASRSKLGEELGSSIVMRDEQVKKAYDTYMAQEKKYYTYTKGYSDIYPAYRSSFTTCLKVFEIVGKAGTNVTDYAGLQRTASKPCFADLDIVASSPITPLANYAKEFKRIINERQKVFDQLEKKTLAEDAAGTRIKELGNDYTKNNPVEALNEFVKDAGFNGELNNFIKLLDDKAKAAK